MDANRPNRPKAEFRGLRETVGITQAHLAGMLGVATRSVKRWESPAYPGYTPPQDAWRALDDAVAAQRDAIETALDIVEERTEELGDPGEVTLIYWTSEEDYRTHHTPPDDGTWHLANANNRAVYAALTALGYKVRFVASGIE